MTLGFHILLTLREGPIPMTFFQAEDNLHFDLPRRLTKQDRSPKQSPSKVGKFASDLAVSECYVDVEGSE